MLKLKKIRTPEKFKERLEEILTYSSEDCLFYLKALVWLEVEKQKIAADPKWKTEEIGQLIIKIKKKADKAYHAVVDKAMKDFVERYEHYKQ